MQDDTAPPHITHLGCYNQTSFGLTASSSLEQKMTYQVNKTMT